MAKSAIGSVFFDPDEQPSVEQYDALSTLKRDIKNVGLQLRGREARYLVDTHYQQQDVRKRLGQRILAAEKFGEPNALLRHLYANQLVIEHQSELGLGAFVRNWKVGRWMQSIVGLNVLIPAALLAYIDIRCAPTAGQIWRFAGLDPGVRWWSAAKAKSLVKDVMGKDKKVTDAHMAELAKRVNRKARNLQNLIKTVYAGKRTQENVIKAVSSRPWSATLKMVCCGKLATSFVRQAHHKDAYYSHIYYARKEEFETRNEHGDYAEYAKRRLAGDDGKTPPDKSTEAFKAYKEGMLPKGEIDGRARRIMVKIFTSHLHQVMYEDYHERDAPKPWILEKDPRHTQFIAPPNWPRDFPGKRLKEFYGAAT